MDIVFATDTVVVAHPVSGVGQQIVHGGHWPADDPVVKAYSKFFTDDPRYGLSSSRPLDPEGNPVDISKKRPRSTDAVETTDAEPGSKRKRG